jgi:hypothetical protein
MIEPVDPFERGIFDSFEVAASSCFQLGNWQTKNLARSRHCERRPAVRACSSATTNGEVALASGS